MTAPKPKPWKVRVLREIEDWVDVHAVTREEAESAALAQKGVKELRGLAVPADKRVGAPKPAGIEEEEETND